VSDFMNSQYVNARRNKKYVSLLTAVDVAFDLREAKHLCTVEHVPPSVQLSEK